MRMLNDVPLDDKIVAAKSIQSITDQVLDEISVQLSAECRQQSEIIDKARENYAAIFALYDGEWEQHEKDIDRLQITNNDLEQNLNKLIETSTERMRAAEERYNKQIADMKLDLEQRKEDYDSNMARFMMEKNQLEESVAALHKAYRLFQSDSVYMSVEELKQKIDSLEKKVKQRDNEIQKMHTMIGRHRTILAEKDQQIRLLEEANSDLKLKLQTALSQQNRLQRALEIRNYAGVEEDRDPDVVPSDSLSYINVLQYLGQIADKISFFISSNSRISVALPDDDVERAMMSENPALMIRTIEQRAEDVVQLVGNLDALEVTTGPKESRPSETKPMILQYLSSHLSTSVRGQRYNPLGHVRELFQAKYVSDMVERRGGRETIRFPEFIILFFLREEDGLFNALQHAARLWQSVEDAKNTELKLFKKFALEGCTDDELSFFLQARFALLGLPPVTEEDPEEIVVSRSVCRQLVENLFGKFGPSYEPIVEKLGRIAKGDLIEYAAFLKVLLDYYQRERLKRRNAVRLMYQSKRYGQPGNAIDFEKFFAMVRSLGYKGELNRVFVLYREAQLIGHGEITLESMLEAMDQLAFHFVTIDQTVTSALFRQEATFRKRIIFNHWMRFAPWFEAFKAASLRVPDWINREIAKVVAETEVVLHEHHRPDELFEKYRKLLDYTQFILSALESGASWERKEENVERQLLILENLVDALIVAAIPVNPNGPPFGVGFEITESK